MILRRQPSAPSSQKFRRPNGRRPSLRRWGRATPAVWLLGALSVTLSAASGAEEAQPISQRAAEHFAQGVAQLVSTEPDHFHRALLFFRRAYAESPAWQILGNLGIAADALERCGEALDAYEQYLARGGDTLDPKEAAHFRADIQRLKSGSAIVHFQLPPGQHLVLDTRHREGGPDVVNRYGPWTSQATLRLLAGNHTVQIVGGPQPFPALNLKLHSGQVTTLALGGADPLTMPPAPLTKRLPSELATRPQTGLTPGPSSGFVWALGGSGLTAAATAGLAAWYSRADRSATQRFNRDCQNQPQAVFDANQCDPWAPDVRASWIKTGAIVAGGLSGALLITGLRLYWSAHNSPTEQPSQAGRSSPTNARWAGWVYPGGVALKARF